MGHRSCVAKENNRCSNLFVIMRSKFDSSARAFINLGKMGRSGWRTAISTIFLIASLGLLSTLVTLIFADWTLFFRNLRAIDVGNIVISGAANPLVCIFGFWLACRTILRRPFRSLISADLTFSIRRCLQGAAVYLCTNVLGLFAMALYASVRCGTWIFPFGHFVWPRSDQVIAAVFAIIAIPFAAFTEELFFRGWLTQTLGQYIRAPMVNVTLVAVLFAAYHTHYDLKLRTLMLVSSLGLSALCLRDQRLELAIGAHTMMNICVVLQVFLFSGPPPGMRGLTVVTTFDWLFLVILKGAVPLALMYGLLQVTRGWFAPSAVDAAGISTFSQNLSGADGEVQGASDA